MFIRPWARNACVVCRIMCVVSCAVRVVCVPLR
jgi:hypothetical protein